MRGKSFSSAFDRDFADIYRRQNCVRRRTFARGDWEISSTVAATVLRPVIVAISRLGLNRARIIVPNIQGEPCIRREDGRLCTKAPAAANYVCSLSVSIACILGSVGAMQPAGRSWCEAHLRRVFVAGVENG
jgi:hypothetical protein